jgi:hypothetical protein
MSSANEDPVSTGESSSSVGFGGAKVRRAPRPVHAQEYRRHLRVDEGERCAPPKPTLEGQGEHALLLVTLEVPQIAVIV